MTEAEGAAPVEVACPTCRTVARLRPRGGQASCLRCGVLIDIEAARRPPAETEPCPICGERVAPGASRCRHCGERLASSSVDPSSVDPPGPPILLRVCGGVLMALPLLSVLGLVLPRPLPIGGLWTLVLALGPRLGREGMIFTALTLTIAHLYLGFGVLRGERAALRWLTALAALVSLTIVALLPSRVIAEHLLMVAVYYAPPCVYARLIPDRLLR